MTKHELLLTAMSLRVMIENDHKKDALEILDVVIEQCKVRPSASKETKTSNKQK